MKIGIIGGSGLENLSVLEHTNEIELNTKYGYPSSSIKVAKKNGLEIFLISRHGFSHTITPTNVNNRANITALKKLGCTEIIATTACGSLKEEIKRGDLLLIDQVIDFTKHRVNTFYNEFKPHKPMHAQFASPFNEKIREKLFEVATKNNIVTHSKGTVVTIEGPRFSSKAESHMYRLLGADIINMSTATEVALANELNIPYASIAMSTDYDCWKDDEEPVSYDEIIRIFKENINTLKKLIKAYLLEVSRK